MHNPVSQLTVQARKACIPAACYTPRKTHTAKPPPRLVSPQNPLSGRRGACACGQAAGGSGEAAPSPHSPGAALHSSTSLTGPGQPIEQPEALGCEQTGWVCAGLPAAAVGDGGAGLVEGVSDCGVWGKLRNKPEAACGSCAREQLRDQYPESHSSSRPIRHQLKSSETWNMIKAHLALFLGLLWLATAACADRPVLRQVRLQNVLGKGASGLWERVEAGSGAPRLGCSRRRAAACRRYAAVTQPPSTRAGACSLYFSLCTVADPVCACYSLGCPICALTCPSCRHGAWPPLTSHAPAP